MASASATREYDVPAAEMWARIGDFYALHAWHPAIASVERGPESGERTVTMADGHVAVERLVEEGASWQTYEPADEDFGVRGFRATLRVHETGSDSCAVEWSSSFETDGEAAGAELVATIESFYDAGLQSLG